ncbi:dUTPase [Microbacterium maritypicum]|uniref:dUTPase n=4 Tax=Microbacterium TaxID=33882 RepID=A0A4Y4BB40_MICMQ|nr:dUTPase [Microbacterium liquefaciens]GGV56013.1 dUTPase [Microbacterium liquefaciens]
MSFGRANYGRRIPDGAPPTRTMKVEIYRMATDYDAPRKSEDDSESIEALKERVPDKLSGSSGDEDSDNPSSFDLPGADLSDLELDVVVLPAQQDEFTCMSCFLVKHRSQLDHEGASGPICKECAA